MSIIIICFSAKPGKESSGLSEKITDKVINVVENAIRLEENERSNFFDNLHYLVRKSAHFLEFAILSALTFCLARSYKFSRKVSVILALSYCLVFAIGDEIHQLFVEARKGRATDVLIDFLGGSAGVGLCWLFVKFKKTAKHKKS